MANNQATILTPDQAKNLRYPLPKSWGAAVGILKGKKRVDALKHQKQIRKEWGQYSKKLARMLHK
ncbi:MAG TPA: hypothetical protein VGA53_04475 [Candidatus Paceibacterota bacterium]